MKLVERLRRPPGPVRGITELPLHAGGVVAIVGTSLRQAVLARVAAEATGAERFHGELEDRAMVLARESDERRWFKAAVFREQLETDDWKPVAVHAVGHGPIGYLERQAAIDYTAVFDELERRGILTGTCPGRLTGGDGSRLKPWGVVLALSAPMAALAHLRDGGIP